MSLTYSVPERIAATRAAFREIGYSEELLLPNYRFADFLSPTYAVREIALAGFAQYPPSYRSAGFGVVIGYNDPDEVRRYTALGAPNIFVVDPSDNAIHHWQLLTAREPRFIETLYIHSIHNAIREKKEEWGPAGILRAKAVGFYDRSDQLDFFDVGLLPVLEREVHKKLDELLTGTITEAVIAYRKLYNREMPGSSYRGLFRLVFRLIAAKLLHDRSYPGAWLSPSVDDVIEAVNAFYFPASTPAALLLDRDLRQLVWDRIRLGLHLENLSPEALAYVYENTFVNADTRRTYDTHATPPEIAEYVVSQLPIEELEPERRTVFEPFAGHAPFLTAALARLRSLLPPQIDTSERHQYFVRMLTGIELDSFACEVARYALMLADYPNPNGWQIVNDNVYTAPAFNAFLTRANIVLCNPPFGAFTAKERKEYAGLQSANRAVEAFLRVLAQPPEMLGFILPRSFTGGLIYRDVRERLAKTYANISITALPDVAFRFSEAETVIVLARNRYGRSRRWYRAFVSRDDYERFTRTGLPTWEDVEDDPPLERDPGLWKNPLARNLRQCLVDHVVIGEIADVHRGFDYIPPIRQHVAQEWHDGFLPGLYNVDGELELYTAVPRYYLNTTASAIRGKTLGLPWHKPKVLANAARITRGPWRIVAAIDRDGLVCTQRFHAIWPKHSVRLEVIAATLNGPVANALLSVPEKSRDNLVRDVKSIPLPKLSDSNTRRLCQLVNEYVYMLNADAGADDLAAVKAAIDTIVLVGYGLPEWLLIQLLDHFGNARHPRTGFTLSEEFQLRHSVLVDKKFSDGLSDTEATELQWSRQLLDAAEASYYAPVREMLITARASISTDRLIGN